MSAGRQADVFRDAGHIGLSATAGLFSVCDVMGVLAPNGRRAAF